MNSVSQPGGKLLLQKSHRSSSPPVDLVDMFDTSDQNLYLRNGEQVIDIMTDVEDTKGNNGMLGKMQVTNLRIIWISDRSNRVNLSLGLNTIFNSSVKFANSKLRGNTQALFLGCKQQNSRFEFIFTNVSPDSTRIFTTVTSVIKAYQSTRMYREVRLRGQFIVDNTKLELLPNETLDEVIHAVWHLGGEQGSLGVFHITNYRIVWCLEADTSSNMSIPYVQMDSIFTKDSKYGKALVIETTKASGHYVLGFRIDPPERVVEVFHKAERYFLDADANPYFGIEVCKENTPQSPQAETVAPVNAAKPAVFISKFQRQDDISIVDERSAFFQSISPTEGGNSEENTGRAYGTVSEQEAMTSAGDVIMYDNYLGLAIERIKDPEIKNMEELWSIG